MVRKNRQGLRKKLFYFFLNGKIHKVLKASRAKDEIIAWSYPDKKRVMYSYSQVEKNMEKAKLHYENLEKLNLYFQDFQEK